MKLSEIYIGIQNWWRENKMRYRHTHVELLESQLAIGKQVIESMLELIPKKGTEMTIIPMTIEDYEFEVEVRMN